MPILHLGVQDAQYTEETGSKSTGDVAEILEAKYHVFEHFWQAHGQEIADSYVAAAARALEDVLSGGTPATSLFTAPQAATKALFTKFIDTQEMDSLGYPGIPTKAALNGVNHRMKRPYQEAGASPELQGHGHI
jgi:hypothetical protein